MRCEIDDKRVVYPKELYDDERYIVRKLDLMSGYGTTLDENYLDMIFSEIETQNGIEYIKYSKTCN